MQENGINVVEIRIILRKSLIRTVKSIWVKVAYCTAAENVMKGEPMFLIKMEQGYKSVIAVDFFSLLIQWSKPNEGLQSLNVLKNFQRF